MKVRQFIAIISKPEYMDYDFELYTLGEFIPIDKKDIKLEEDFKKVTIEFTNG